MINGLVLCQRNYLEMILSRGALVLRIRYCHCEERSDAAISRATGHGPRTTAFKPQRTPRARRQPGSATENTEGTEKTINCGSSGFRVFWDRQQAKTGNAVAGTGRVGLALPKKGWWGKPHPATTIARHMSARILIFLAPLARIGDNTAG